VNPVDVHLPSGDTVTLAPEDAVSLIEALWGVSGSSGAVVAVGKIRHALESGAEVLADLDETRAIRAALEDGATHTGRLEELRVAASRRSPRRV
jgi:hypothetical protein